MNKDKKWITYAIALSERCPPSDAAFAVGAAIVDAHGDLLAYGFSRETDPNIHAEESALKKLHGKGIDLSGATMYSSLEPCTTRLTKSNSCADLIIACGMKRVVFAASEPSIFVPGRGAEKLRTAGIEVIILPEFSTAVRAVQTPTIQNQWRINR